MFSLSFEVTYKVLRFDFAGIFVPQDLDNIDIALVRFLGGEGRRHAGVRSLYDLTEVEMLAVPRSKFADRARKAPIGDLPRIVVAPREGPDDFGRSYREERAFSTHRQPIIVPTLADAYTMMELVDPVFRPLC